MKHPLVLAGLLFLSATPSFAQDMTTLQYALSKGIVIHADRQGRPLDMRVTYKDDGTSTMNVMGPGTGGGSDRQMASRRRQALHGQSDESG